MNTVAKLVAIASKPRARCVKPCAVRRVASLFGGDLVFGCEARRSPIDFAEHDVE
jgi:hypothetical protein